MVDVIRQQASLVARAARGSVHFVEVPSARNIRAVFVVAVAIDAHRYLPQVGGLIVDMLRVTAAHGGWSGIVERSLQAVAVGSLACLAKQPCVAVHEVANVTRLSRGVRRNPCSTAKVNLGQSLGR